MKKLHMLTAAAGILLALAGPSLAASRTPASGYSTDVNTVRTYGDRDDNNPPAGRNLGHDAYAQGEAERQYQDAPSQNRPYSYGADPGEDFGGPNGW